MNEPLVTCICPTMPGRESWLLKAIDCFESQTYCKRELLTDPDAGTIGEKRNRLCEAARGEIILHWDDDDWSAPGRIADQVRRLMDSGKAVTGYNVMRFTDGSRWWKNSNQSRLAFGTSLCYRRGWWASHRFPEIQLGEDSFFLNAARRENQLIAVDAGDLMYATNHAGNTSKRTIGQGWELVDPPAYFQGQLGSGL